jgi:hypothetical protein
LYCDEIFLVMDQFYDDKSSCMTMNCMMM